MDRMMENLTLQRFVHVTADALATYMTPARGPSSDIVTYHCILTCSALTTRTVVIASGAGVLTIVGGSQERQYQ